jgi:hypothetical protein
MPIPTVLDGFDFGPDVDPRHDPVFDDAPTQDASGAGSAPASSTPSSTPAADPTDAPADRAWTRFCQGSSPSDIAHHLHLDRATVLQHLQDVHQQAQADRRADRSLALTRALDALGRIQATAWEQIARDQGHERVVWDLYVRAAAQSAQLNASLAGGYRIRPPSFHARTTRLLSLILAAIRESARLELLYDAHAPARDGDTADDQPQNGFVYFMMRRSDQETLAELERQRQAGGPSTGDVPSAPTDSAADSTPSIDPTRDPPSAPPDVVAAGAPAAQAFAGASSADDTPVTSPAYDVRHGPGAIPLPDHLQPDLRPDGTDDWFVSARMPMRRPDAQPTRPGQPQRRRRPWDHSR